MVLSWAALIVVLWQLHHFSAQDYRPPGVGPDDYTRWRMHFGQSSGSGSGASGSAGVSPSQAAVPEPASAILTAVAVLAMMLRGRRRR
jgi:hypothetical protein